MFIIIFTLFLVEKTLLINSSLLSSHKLCISLYISVIFPFNDLALSEEYLGNEGIEKTTEFFIVS